MQMSKVVIVVINISRDTFKSMYTPSTVRGVELTSNSVGKGILHRSIPQFCECSRGNQLTGSESFSWAGQWITDTLVISLVAPSMGWAPAHAAYFIDCSKQLVVLQVDRVWLETDQSRRGWNSDPDGHARELGRVGEEKEIRREVFFVEQSAMTNMTKCWLCVLAFTLVVQFSSQCLPPNPFQATTIP